MSTYYRTVVAPLPVPARKRGAKGPARVIVPEPAVLPSWRLVAGLCLLLAIFTLGVYSRAGSHPFIQYDDQTYVTENDHVKAGLSWNTLKWAMTSEDASNWHPVTW